MDEGTGTKVCQTLTLPGRLPGLNDVLLIRGRNRYAWGAKKKKLEEEIGWEIVDQRIHSVGPCRLYFRWFEKDRRRDKDNIAAGGRKPILDALVTHGVLPGDGWNAVDGFSDHFDVDKECPRIEIVIVPM